MIYKTVARIGRFAPLVRAAGIGEAMRLIALFQKTMQSQSIECKIGLAGVVAADNSAFDVSWSKDYANTTAPDERMIKASTGGKAGSKINGFYKAKTARKINDVFVVNPELAALFATLTKG